jgi:hypothetical protein
MKNVQAVPMPEVSSLTARFEGGRLVLEGTMATQNPAADLGPFLKAFHQAIVQDRLPEMVVDVTKLTFVNSSAIRLFVDWTTWIRKEETSPYRLAFVTDAALTWQKTTFPVLKNLAPSVVFLKPPS